MKSLLTLTFACLLLNAGATLAGRALAADEVFSPIHARLQKRAECGMGSGSCPKGSCCSGSGFCGTTEDYCDGSSCQLDYSDSCDTFFGPPGISTESIPRPSLGNVPYGSIITTCITPGVIALTFDDGPYIYTNGMLDLLDQYGVKATFFVTGNNRGKGHIDDSSTPWPTILRRMHSAGHHIASHTWTHRNLIQVNSTIRKTEMIYNEMAFRNLFGWIPTYMRPPYLECDAASGCLDLMKQLGYHVVNTNLDTKDYEYDGPDLIQIAKNRYSAGVSSNSGSNNYIVLAHDVHEQTVHNLTSYMIQTARNRGYKLVTVGECLGDPKENWYRTVGSQPTPTQASTQVPQPTSTTKPLNISPDQRCGGTTGYTCMNSRFGNCCSWYGYCGSSDAYCGTGCDSDFGECKPPTGSIQDTTNGLCGSTFKATCANYGSKTCCSQYGYW
ncbi:Hypothetical protein NCS54_01464300 [Fusarium falciforme]|uniref:Hypothetical protein n=1 Tax=Fusarium falciforme TaxID=195108 RepID=UPI0023010803|nr:Hypothetical protein NCS54_01464300 [Fusarium falciforme]WAO96946.1 Hypothetical protein NCS54_01464300 [Fusarium falciforme]